jgi:mersacidin/lichenicidin family type 2 lantibiotic
MKSIDIVRAWKDEEYRDSLSAEERAALPANPAGMIELGDADLGQVTGGSLSISLACTTAGTHSCDTPCQSNSGCS